MTHHNGGKAALKDDFWQTSRRRGLWFCLVLLAAVATSASPAVADKLRFVTLEFAPFIYGEKQQVAGPGHDVIAAVCERAAIECSFDIFPWRRAQDLIRDGDADGMMVIGRNAAREQWLHFSPPIFRTEYGFFVGIHNRMTFADPAQLAGFRVGVFAPSNTQTQLQALRDEMIKAGLAPIEIDGHPDDAAGMRKLAAGRLDAVYSNRDRAWSIIKAEELDGMVRYAGSHKAILYYAGIRKDYSDNAIVQRFFSAWQGLFAGGEAQALIEAYGLEPAPIE